MTADASTMKSCARSRLATTCGAEVTTSRLVRVRDMLGDANHSSRQWQQIASHRPRGQRPGSQSTAGDLSHLRNSHRLDRADGTRPSGTKGHRSSHFIDVLCRHICSRSVSAEARAGERQRWVLACVRTLQETSFQCYPLGKNTVCWLLSGIVALRSQWVLVTFHSSFNKYYV